MRKVSLNLAVSNQIWAKFETKFDKGATMKALNVLLY